MMSLFARWILLMGLFAGLTSVTLAQPSSFTFTTFNHPLGIGGTLGLGINDAGQIVGDYIDGSGNHHGFLYSSGVFTAIDDPLGSVETQAYGINNAGQTVGNYFPGNGTGRHGFLYSGGIFTTIDDPSATGCCDQSAYSAAQGINNLGQIVGIYVSRPSLHGFLYNGGIFTTIDDPSATPQTYRFTDCCALYTSPVGINDAGQIVGSYIDGSGNYHGFLYNGGIFTTYDHPLATGGTFAIGINNGGQIVGYYTDGSGNHSFLYSGGIFTTVADPIATVQTIAHGINNLGQIVGFYADGTGNHGFLATPTAPTPQAAIQNIINSVNNLVTLGAMSSGNANALVSKLQAAIDSLNRGNGNAARGQLNAFVNQVDALLKSGRLTSSQAQGLIDAANNVLAQIP